MAALTDRFERAADGLGGSFVRVTDRRSARLAALSRLNESFGYKSVLARGYAVVRGPDGHAIEGLDRVAFGDLLTIEMRDGEIEARAGNRADGEEPRKRARTRKARVEDAGQPTLL